MLVRYDSFCMFTVNEKVKSECKGCHRADVAYYASGLCRSDYVGWMRQRRVWRKDGVLRGSNPYCNACGFRGAGVKIREGTLDRDVLCTACQRKTLKKEKKGRG